MKYETLTFIDKYKEGKHLLSGTKEVKQVRFLHNIDDAEITKAHLYKNGCSNKIYECIAWDQTCDCPFCYASKYTKRLISPAFSLFITLVIDREDDMVKYFKGGGQLLRLLLEYERINGSITGVDFQISRPCKKRKRSWMATPIIKSFHPLSDAEQKFVAEINIDEAIVNQYVSEEEAIGILHKIEADKYLRGK